MATYFHDYQTPKFLLAEKPIKKENDFDNSRVWIYAPFCLSLIELICLNDVDINLTTNKYRKEYKYCNYLGITENWLLVYVQDNTEVVGYDKEIVMNEAWEFYQEYLIWEDYEN